MVGSTGGDAASVFKACVVGSRVLFHGSCNTKDARVGGWELTGGGGDAERIHAAVLRCAGGSSGGGSGAAGSGGEQGGEGHGEGGGGRDVGVGGVFSARTELSVKS